MDFRPLEIPTSNITEELDARYRVVAPDGNVITVVATCAAEAVEKSEISNPVKIVSAAYERSVMLEKNVLNQGESKVLTDIDAETPNDLSFLIVNDLPQEEKEPFAEMSFLEIAAKVEGTTENGAVAGDDIAAEGSAQVNGTEADTKPTEPNAVQQEEAEGEKELSAEEVRELLNEGDDDEGSET